MLYFQGFFNKQWPHRLSVRTQDFQSWKPGATPGGVTEIKTALIFINAEDKVSVGLHYSVKGMCRSYKRFFNIYGYIEEVNDVSIL